MGWVQVDTGLIRHAPEENPATWTETDETVAACETPGTGRLSTGAERKDAQADAEGAEFYPEKPSARDGSAPVPTDVPPSVAETDGQPDADAARGAEQALAAQLLRAVRERVGRAEKSVLRSMAEQRGLPEEKLYELLAKARAESTGDVPQGEVQADTTEARLRLRLLHSEVERVGAELGLLDADAALRLMEEGFATVDGDGKVNGVREALESLRKRKGYLFAPPARAAWAQRVGTAAPAMAGGVEEAFYRKNPTLRK